MPWRRKRKTHELGLEEVMLDSRNIPRFNTQQFEGVIERPITKFSLTVIWVVCIICIIVFGSKLFSLQIVNGETYLAKAENNRLENVPLFAERGVIYDRNEVELAWNELPRTDEPFLRRVYKAPGFGHILGFVSLPAKDVRGYFWRKDIEGQDGVEKFAQHILHGTNGSKLVEVDATGQPTSENLVSESVPGGNIYLTLDSRIQQKLYESIAAFAQSAGFVGGSGVIMDVRSGELLALVNYPETDPNILSEGADQETIQSYATNSGKPYLNRAVAGLFTPGSTVKPYLAIAALQEKIITPATTVVSTGRVEIPNPFFPDQPSIFRDWRPGGHGVTDIYHAIADSVNTFFYAIGGGYGSIQGLGIARIDTYTRLFGLGEKTGYELGGEATGVIPNMEWKKKIFPNDPWRIGDTYNSAIGQFGFQVTPLELVRAVGALANRGTLVTPHIIQTDTQKHPTESITAINPEYYTIIHNAMRRTVTDGTGSALNVPYVHVAAKTGTAQTGAGNKFMNSWSTGFFPIENPRYAFVVVMERAQSTNQMGASTVVRQLFDFMATETPEYFVP